MFANNLTEDPVYYFTVAICVTLSIVLHELGHGLAAIQQGDDTPIVTGHMTWNRWCTWARWASACSAWPALRSA